MAQGQAEKPAEDASSGEGGGASAEEREREEARQQREAEFDEQLRARAVRADLLGQDRHFRRYWWLQGALLRCSLMRVGKVPGILWGQ